MSASLYDRLGQEQGISRIVRGVIKKHLENPLISSRFAAVKDLDRLHRVSVEFFCMGSGGPQAYTGRDLVATHKHMNVSEQELIAAIDDIVAVLEENGIDPQTRSDVIGILYSLKPQVLRL